MLVVQEVEWFGRESDKTQDGETSWEAFAETARIDKNTSAKALTGWRRGNACKLGRR